MALQLLTLNSDKAVHFEGIKVTDRMFTEALQIGEPGTLLHQAAETVPQLSGRWRSTECGRLWKFLAKGRKLSSVDMQLQKRFTE